MELKGDPSNLLYDRLQEKKKKEKKKVTRYNNQSRESGPERLKEQ
jgi:hypothetical protein